MSGQTDKGTITSAIIKTAGTIIVALITTIAGIFFVHVPNQRELAFDEGMDEGLNQNAINIEQQLEEAYAQGFADGELSIQNSEQVDEDLLAEYIERIEGYQNRISDLESEIESLSADSTIPSDNENEQIYLPDENEASPVSLFTLPLIDNLYWVSNLGRAIDSFGENHSEEAEYVIISRMSDYIYRGEYFLDFDFSTLRGRLAAHEDHRSNAIGYLRVYAISEDEEDWVLIYNSDEITRRTQVFDFEVDVSDAKFIKLTLGGFGRIILLDPVLER